ncbi:NAD(P)-dependent oxidoreductase [Pontibacter sp. G13]|uniref:SDR family oxidoreductase n=1 Tax=Pontibacter sp. G13 TaxID=3074898 RepID=UPI00288C3161|nr:NAD(P)-dependent oxidoreductase [Pontibacter sp. G13]WNJ20985.1 NAD(P)-dependent oxidoreductase [Pontibacter sp. G13]
MDKKIILTGSNGLLGQKIVNLLTGRPHVQLTATARGINRHPIREGYTYQSLDLLDEAGWEALFESIQPTELINTAAMTMVDKAEGDHETCDQINIDAVQMLARLCKKYGTRLIHISTDFIFDGTEGPYDESATPNPVNYYGLSKWKAEQVIEASGVDHVILRTILLYGMTPAMSRSNIVLWVKSSLENGKPINIVNDQVRNPTLAEDLAVATVSATMRDVKGVYHISGPETMKISDLAYRIADYWKLDRDLITEISSDSLNQAAKRPPITGFVILKAQTELGYQPHTLEQGFALLDRQLKALENV